MGTERMTWVWRYSRTYTMRHFKTRRFELVKQKWSLRSNKAIVGSALLNAYGENTFWDIRSVQQEEKQKEQDIITLEDFIFLDAKIDNLKKETKCAIKNVHQHKSSVPDNVHHCLRIAQDLRYTLMFAKRNRMSSLSRFVAANRNVQNITSTQYIDRITTHIIMQIWPMHEKKPSTHDNPTTTSSENTSYLFVRWPSEGLIVDMLM